MFWKKKASDIEDDTYLTEADRRDLTDKFFIASAILISLVIVSTSLSLAFSYKREAKDVEQVLNTIYAYMATATNDEYEKIAAEIRNDLVFHTYDDTQWEYIKLIPNTTEMCRLELDSFPCQAYLLSTNNGQLYSLDIYQDGEKPATKSGGTSIRCGYDEVSETSIQVISESDTSKVTIDRGRGILSIHRMKTLFCDDCIKKILETNKSVLTPEFIIFDSAKHSFYPIESGEHYRLGDYMLDVEFTDWNTYVIQVAYAAE